MLTPPQIFLMLTIPSIASCTSRMGKAKVIDHNAAPCFTVTSEEEQRVEIKGLNAVSVTDLSVHPVRVVWDFYLTSSERLIPLSSASCVLYGIVPKGSEVTTPTGELTPGHVYSVSLKTNRHQTSDPTFAYEAKFCLVPKPGNVKHVVQQIPWDAEQKRWRYDICKVEIQ